MSDSVGLSLFDTLGQVPDPYRERAKRYLLTHIRLIAAWATVGATEGWREIAKFGRAEPQLVQEVPGAHGQHSVA